jgi:hypothetical protein
MPSQQNIGLCENSSTDFIGGYSYLTPSGLVPFGLDGVCNSVRNVLLKRRRHLNVQEQVANLFPHRKNRLQTCSRTVANLFPHSCREHIPFGLDGVCNPIRNVLLKRRRHLNVQEQVANLFPHSCKPVPAQNRLQTCSRTVANLFPHSCKPVPAQRIGGNIPAQEPRTKLKLCTPQGLL